METAVAPRTVPALLPMVDLDDLHDADRDAVLAEQLDEAVGSVGELTELVARRGADALSAHALRAHVLLLAVF
ncbi:hypothetical protein [Blastococcus haudaquaticus]|uniref:Uncharacterized protein n=1 Tax=Blastococcus haudaquaticus TaxID=1938745 RepID=A0A286GTX4_9ACTN|nr:hypothetical protein [Blastococcus haudaquaticus]SOD99013.1 hypothetical protein SAMN06272739_2136 [Blastococcus haudaquaticus]